MSLSTELDLRLYTSTGLRKRFPAAWLSSVEFSLSERGGCIDGVITTNARWEELQLAGTEYVEIRLWGQLLYRGWVRQPTNNISVPETAELNLYGGMELLNGYVVQRNYAYLPAKSIDLVFSALISDFVTRSYPAARLTTWTTDTTGVSGLGITVAQFQPQGKTVSQALNDLCDLAPGQLIWGCDIDGSGNNRVYLRPRSQAVATTYRIGGNVTLFSYPQDCTQIVNRLLITGGPLQPPNLPNLLQNPSFETVAQPGETTSNLLANPSFETANPVSTTHPLYWQVTNDPTLATANGRTGQNALDMDNTPTAPESVSQTVTVLGAQPVYQSCWFNLGTATSATLNLTLAAYDVSNTLLGSDTQSNALTTAADGQLVWQHYLHAWTTPANTNTVVVTYTLYSANGSTGNAPGGNTNLDDCAFWTQQPVSEHWMVGIPAGTSSVNSIQWDYGNGSLDGSEGPPFDGDLMVKLSCTVQGSPPTTGAYYAELCTTYEAQPSVNTYTTYTVAFRVQCPAGGGNAYAGVRVWYQGKVQTSVPGPQWPGVGPSPITPVITSIPAGDGWTLVTYQFTIGSQSDHVDCFLRLTSSGTYYVDGAQMTAGWIGGATGQTQYSQDSTYRGVRDINSTNVSPYLTTAAANSMMNWGEREATVSNNDVVDEATADAFAIGYLNAYAVPAVQARLTIEQATAPLPLSGTVALLLNKLPDLPQGTPPPPLFPSKVQYRVSESVVIEADLNRERPDLAQLLRVIGGTGTGAF